MLRVRALTAHLRGASSHHSSRASASATNDDGEEPTRVEYSSKPFPSFALQFPEAHRRFSELFGLSASGSVEDGARYTVAAKELVRHGKERSGYAAGIPQCVLWPETTEEVVAVVKTADEFSIPIVPYGSGTSLEGHTAAIKGGICINLKRMNKVIRTNFDDMDIELQPGVDHTKLNRDLRKKGFFVTPDPAPGASIGGMVATNCSGPNACRYGMMQNNIVNLTVVLADGRVIQTGGRARKSSSGYDLTHLFVGSEGTLGIFTSITLRLQPVPEETVVGVCPFPTIESCSKAVIEIMQKGIDLQCLEMMDDVMSDAVNKFLDTNYDISTNMFIKFSGSKKQVAHQIEEIRRIIKSHGGGELQMPTDSEDKEEIWYSRKAALWATETLRTDGSKSTLITDVAVPISRFAEMMKATKEGINKSFLKGPLVAHAADGNFHSCILFDGDNEEHHREAHRLNDNMVKRAVAMEGTATGEHGIGRGKRAYLRKEFGADAIAVMHSIKRALDPKNILNPGKAI